MTGAEVPRVVEPPEQRRVLAVLVAAQVLSGAGIAAGVTVGALLAQEMLETTSLAGLPSALFTAGSAAAAVLVGRLSHRSGRRPGLAAGYLVGALGAVGVVVAAVLDDVPMLFAAFTVYGAGTATNLQARYAGADLAAPHRRGRAVSTVLVATTLGAVAGPNLVPVMGDVAAAWGIPVLAGPFLLAAAAYGSAGVVLWLLLRPDPLLLARGLAARAASSTTAGPVHDVVARPRVVALAATVMVLTQVVMVAIMTMTPIHMQAHGHDLAATGLVIGIHIGAMYLPSPISGWLVDRVGAPRVAAAAGVVLLAAGLVAGRAPTDSVPVLALGLGLLGFGWSLGLVSGTTMLSAAVPLATRARTQGSVDLTIAIAGAGGGMASGFVVAGASFATLSVLGGVLALAIVPVVALASRGRDAVPHAAAPASR